MHEHQLTIEKSTRNFFRVCNSLVNSDSSHETKRNDSICRFVVAHEILGIPADATRSPRFTRMAHAYCHMFTKAPAVFKDTWGAYFFEAWAFTILLLLQVWCTYCRCARSHEFDSMCSVLSTIRSANILKQSTMRRESPKGGREEQTRSKAWQSEWVERYNEAQ